MNNSFGPTSTNDKVLRGINPSARRAIVSGVSAGLGVETARALAAHGAEVIGAARDLSKAQAATEQVRAQAASGGSLQLVQLDLASLDSVKKLPRRKSYVYIDIKRRKCKAGAGDVLIPLIRAAATIGFAIAPCSLGFVIIAVSEQLIRSIIVGDDPEMLVSDLQNQFPNDVIEIIENDDVGLVAKVVDSIERPDQALELPLDIRGPDFQRRA